MNKADVVMKRFGDTVRQWIGFLDDYTLEVLRQQPSFGGWSLGQVYVHIIDDTSYQVEQMKLALKSEEHSEEVMQANAMGMFANDGFPDVRIEGPATYEVIAQPESIAQLKSALDEILKEVSALFDANNFLVIKGKSRHPGLGYFSALEWLQFMEMHMRHHIRQKERIVN